MKILPHPIGSTTRKNGGMTSAISVIVTIAITIFMAIIIINWSDGIATPKSPKQVTVSILRQDEYNGTITVINIMPAGTTIKKFTVMGEAGVVLDSGNNETQCRSPNPDYDEGKCDGIREGEKENAEFCKMWLEDGCDVQAFGTDPGSPGGTNVDVGDTITSRIFTKFNEHMIVQVVYGDGMEATVYENDV